MSEMARRELARQSFLRESVHVRVSSPLFSALARSCAADEEMVDLASVARPGQSAGMLLLCIAQYLLLKSPEPSLARYFPDLTAEPAPAEEAFTAFREFCLDRRADLAELLSWRTVSTNLVEKASFLLPAIQHVAGLSDKPLTLLEICCSAGLNLVFDEYHYDYGGAGRVGVKDSPVQLNCKIVGEGRPPVESMPFVAERVGVDLVKVDPSSPLDRLWMEAVLFPEWTAERKRLRDALTIRAARNVRTIIGDALDVLPSLFEELPGSLCILQCYCIGHWSEAGKVELEELLRSGSRHREIHRLAVEMPESESPQAARRRLAKLAAAGVPLLQKSFPSLIEHTSYVGSEATTRILGEGDGFGLWLDWRVRAS
jgi:hypothetical protein